MGKKTQKEREDAFSKLLSHFDKEGNTEKIDLMAFFDLLDEHNVMVREGEWPGTGPQNFVVN